MSPSTTLTTPRLSEVATKLVIPEGIVSSVWPRVEARLNDAGVHFDLWQQGLASAALGCRSNGKYAASVGGVVLSIPRQVGKTFTVGNIIIGLCLEFPGTRWIWTSHHLRTTTNTFRSFQSMVRRKQIAPHLKPNRSNGIREANGEQEIAFRNGSIIMFGARAQGFGRGLDEIDGEVFDEAQILGIKALEDMVPATNQAKHPHGGLLFFMGTPPRPGDDGESFTAKRKRALDGGSKDQMYVELSADKDASPDDREQWARANPSYPRRTPLEAMLRMRENIPDEGSWLREAMGIWDEEGGGGLITPAQWERLRDPQSTPIDPVSFGIYVNRLQTNAAIAVAARRADGKVHVGIIPAAKGQDSVETLPGIDWIPARAKELQQWRPAATVVDNYSPAASLVPEFEKLQIPVERTNGSDLARACSTLYAYILEDTLRHQGSPSLALSVMGGKKRDLSDGWAWDRKDNNSDITQLMAVTLAVHGLATAPPPTEVWSFYT